MISYAFHHVVTNNNFTREVIKHPLNSPGIIVSLSLTHYHILVLYCTDSCHARIFGICSTKFFFSFFKGLPVDFDIICFLYCSDVFLYYRFSAEQLSVVYYIFIFLLKLLQDLRFIREGYYQFLCLSVIFYVVTVFVVKYLEIF